MISNIESDRSFCGLFIVAYFYLLVKGVVFGILPTEPASGDSNYVIRFLKEEVILHLCLDYLYAVIGNLPADLLPCLTKRIWFL